MKTPSQETIVNLKKNVRGRVVFPDDPGYDNSRKIWNAMIDRRPAVIVQCAEAEDVPPAISLARQHGLEISVRGGGHNIAGSCVCDGGLMIDFSNMKRVRVDEGKKRAFVEPGATLADFDKAVQAHRLATPLGINSTTGIAGLTLGGGFGWLTRMHGMTIDNLVSAEIITADGEKLCLSENENAELFWAIRGGGGNFGVITQFEFKLHPLEPQITAGLMVFPIEQAKQVLRRYREFVESAPEELNVWVVLRKAPPLPFLPEHVHGKEVIVLAIFYAGDLQKGEEPIDRLRGFGSAYGEKIGTQPYVEWQRAFDPLLAPGSRNYWKSHNFTELSDGAIDSMIEFTGKLPTAECEIFIGLIAGAANRVAGDATAYAARNAKLVMNVHGRWDDPKKDEACIAWAREFFKSSAPYASGGAYVNFMTEEEGDRIRAAYGSNYDRLVRIKRKYDPENVFHLNQNIRP